MRIDRFLGLAPAIVPMHLPTAHAQEAVNCYSDKGFAITPTRAPAPLDARVLDINGNIFAGTPITLHRSGDVWVAWDHWVHIAPDPREFGSRNAFLFVDGGALYRSSDVWLLNKVAPKRVGIERPAVRPNYQIMDAGTRGWTVAPDASISCTNSDIMCGGDAQPPEPRSYVFTVVNEMDEESPPSQPTEVIYVGATQAVVMTAPGPVPDGAVKWRWYRTLSAGDGGGDWAFVRETSTATLFDVYDALQLGDALDTGSHWPPAPNLQGVVLLGHANVVVWDDTGTLWTSCNRLPHAFPPAARRQLPDHIVTARSTPPMVESGVSTETAGEGNHAYFLTRGRPTIGMYVPDDLDIDHLELRTLQLDEPCLSPWGATTGEGACFYASERGIVRLSGGEASSILDQEFSLEYWSRWQPHAMKLAYERGVLFGFEDVGGWVLPISTYLRDREHILSRTSVTASAVYCAPDTGLTLALSGPILYKWREATVNMTAVWHSSEFQLPEYWNPGFVKVDADVYLPPSARDREAWAVFVAYCKSSSNPEHFWDLYPEHLDSKPYVAYRQNPITIELFRNGKLFARKAVIPMQPHALPVQGRGIYWSIRITTNIPIVRVMLAKSMRDMAAPTDDQEEK